MPEGEALSKEEPLPVGFGLRMQGLVDGRLDTPRQHGGCFWEEWGNQGRQI